jgi:hypothetical protein
MVDIVTNRHASLHADLVERLGEPSGERSHLYLAAYRPVKTGSGSALNTLKRPATSLADWAEQSAEEWGDQLRSENVEGFTGRSV